MGNTFYRTIGFWLSSVILCFSTSCFSAWCFSVSCFSAGRAIVLLNESVMDLSALNKSSAKVAEFPVRLAGGKVLQYTYKNKTTGSDVQASKFEVCMVGPNPESYCIGYVRASFANCSKAKEKFTDGSVWTLSKAVFDTYTNASYISTPVPHKIDLQKSTMTDGNSDQAAEKAFRETMPLCPVPPRSVADVSCIRTNRCSDLIAIVKGVARDRRSKSGEDIVDVDLIDNSETSPGKLALIKVGVFGAAKIALIKAHVGEPMVFFNLSFMCSGATTQINHYVDEIAALPPACPKTTTLLSKKTELSAATNTELLTQQWTPHQSKDVSGPQPLSCAAFLDFTTATPDAAVPPVVQAMWMHIEEPEPDTEVLDASGTRVWYTICGRDASGSARLGVPQRNAFSLSSCSTMEDFLAKHAAGDLNMPLLCHARISRNIKTPALDSSSQGGASQPATKYVNHIIETVEPVSWDPASAPNASYSDVIGILNNCPPHAEGVVFAFLADIKSDPHYGFRLDYDGREGPKCLYVAALIGSEIKSTTEAVGNGFKVITTNVKDVANPDCASSSDASQLAAPGYATVGYCTLANLTGLRMDPPRGKPMRCAIALFTKKDVEGFHIHKLEYIEPDQVSDATRCMQKLRTLSKKIHPAAAPGMKRSQSLDLEAAGQNPQGGKKARTLQAVPTDLDLEDDAST